MTNHHRKKVKQKPANVAPPPDAPSKPPAPSIPFARYTSVVGVHTTLLLFTALFVPRTPILKALFPPSLDQSSLDRPQHKFLADLTANPAVTVGSVCVGIAMIQVWWAGWVREWWWMSFVQGEAEEEKRAQRILLEKSKIPALADALITSALASFFFGAVLILLGAPLSSHILQTLSFSWLLSLLIVFPASYTIGPLPVFGSLNKRIFLSNTQDSTVMYFTWIRLFVELSPRTAMERALVYPFLGTLLGAWAGAIPLALDWDRPWQAYPLPPAAGAVLGYILSSMWALTESGVRQLAMDERYLKKTA